MASNRQIEANRKNAQKCTGPNTAAGKEKSSQNALKTGLDAKSEVLRFESRPDYEALIAVFYSRFQPTVPEDRALVDMLIRSEWLLRRYTSIDAALWEHEFFRTGETSLGAAFLKNEQALDRVGKRINWAQNNYQRALRQLLNIRAKRAKEEAAEPEPEPDPDPRRQNQLKPNHLARDWFRSSQRRNPPGTPHPKTHNRRKIPPPPPKTMIE